MGLFGASVAMSAKRTSLPEMACDLSIPSRAARSRVPGTGVRRPGGIITPRREEADVHKHSAEQDISVYGPCAGSSTALVEGSNPLVFRAPLGPGVSPELSLSGGASAGCR